MLAMWDEGAKANISSSCWPQHHQPKLNIAQAMYRSKMPSFPRIKPLPLGVNFTAYRFPATPSVDLSLFHDCPLSSVFRSVPLPPTAYPSLLLFLNLQESSSLMHGKLQACSWVLSPSLCSSKI